MIDKLDLVRAEILQEKLTKRFNKIPKSKKHTYTYDNGTEIGQEDKDLEKKMKLEIYRAYPYHSWERGCNENYNGLIDIILLWLKNYKGQVLVLKSQISKQETLDYIKKTNKFFLEKVK